MVNVVGHPETSLAQPETAERFWWPTLTLAVGVGCLLALLDSDWPVTVPVVISVGLFLIWFRSRWVLGALVSAIAAMAMAIAVADDLALLPLVGYSCFHLGRKTPLRLSVPVGAAIAIALVIGLHIIDRGGLQLLTIIGLISIVAMPLLVGVVLRQQQEQVRSHVEAATAQRLEQEKLAIARDLHDIVAHGLTAVAIQSGAASHLFDSSPERAKEALDNVTEAARATLTELRAMVGELRSNDGSQPQTVLDPITTAIDRISPDLSLAVVDPGLPVDTPHTVRVALERVTGEALANVIAHGGGGPTIVELAVDPEQLALSVENEIGPQPTVRTSSGFGIIGMTERVAAVGGRLTTTALPNGYRVVAIVPRKGW